MLGPLTYLTGGRFRMRLTNSARFAAACLMAGALACAGNWPRWTTRPPRPGTPLPPPRRPVTAGSAQDATMARRRADPGRHLPRAGGRRRSSRSPAMAARAPITGVGPDRLSSSSPARSSRPDRHGRGGIGTMPTDSIPQRHMPGELTHVYRRRFGRGDCIRPRDGPALIGWVVAIAMAAVSRLTARTDPAEASPPADTPVAAAGAALADTAAGHRRRHRFHRRQPRLNRSRRLPTTPA